MAQRVGGLVWAQQTAERLRGCWLTWMTNVTGDFRKMKGLWVIVPRFRYPQLACCRLE